MSNVAKVSFVEDHEVDEANALIKEAFRTASGGKEFEFRPAGYMIAIMIYVRPEEIKTVQTPEGPKKLFLPSSVTAEDKYVSSVGLVVATGPEAYQGRNDDGSPRFKEPWCRPGSFVLFPRGEGYFVTYRGVPLLVIPDDRIIATVTEPSDVMTGTAEYKI